MKILALFWAGILVAFTGCEDIADLTFLDCPPGTPGAPEANNLQVKHFFVTGCSVQPCKLNKSVIYDVEVHMALNFTAKGIYSFISAVLTAGPPIHLTKLNLCEYIIVGTCDNIQPGTEIGVRIASKVEEWYPTFDGLLRVIIKDDKSTPQFCGQVNISIQTKPITQSLGYEIMALG